MMVIHEICPFEPQGYVRCSKG